MPKKSSTLNSSHHQHLILASGTLSTSFFIANLYHNFHLHWFKIFTEHVCILLLRQSSPTKFSKFIAVLKSRVINTSPHTEPSHIPTDLTFFSPATEDEICKLLSVIEHLLWPIGPISLLLFWNTAYLHFSLPLLTLLHLRPKEKHGQPVFKLWCFSRTVQALLCHPGLFWKNIIWIKDLSNYRPISHLSFLSKLTERLVKLRLTHHLSSNDLLNSFQSACLRISLHQIVWLAFAGTHFKSPRSFHSITHHMYTIVIVYIIHPIFM